MCFKQAGLMQDLRARLINGGFPEVEFRILNTKSAVNESEGFWRLRSAADHPTIPVLQEVSDDSLWHELLDGAVDHILLLDRCSRLTYQVITPWSILHFPYVKAAILSTYTDDPCGPCAVPLPDSSLEQDSSADDLFDASNFTPQLQENATYVKEDGNLINMEANGTTTGGYETADIVSSMESPYYSSQEQNQGSGIPDATTDINFSPVLAAEDNVGIITSGETYERVKTHDIDIADIQENIVIDSYQDTPSSEPRATLAPLTERSDGTVPIRVVMHAPHKHRHYDGTVTQHEYLELQTGNPDYHGHLVNDNILPVNSNEEQTQRRKKYKAGQRRKGKLQPEAIQAQTQEGNYEDTKLKHHRHKERPEKKKLKSKSDEKTASEEEAITLPELLPTQSLLKHTGEENAEVAAVEIPQDIQEHYDYRNMPHFSSKHLHKPLRIMEVTTATSEEVTESSSTTDQQVQTDDTMDYPAQNTTTDTDGIVSKAMTSDKQIIKTNEKIKDHKKWKPHLKGNPDSERDITEAGPQPTEPANAHLQHQPQDYDALRNPPMQVVTSDVASNVIDSEEERTHQASASTVALSDEDDDESKKQIIQHYSQLLKWIHYSLPDTRT